MRNSFNLLKLMKNILKILSLFIFLLLIIIKYGNTIIVSLEDNNDSISVGDVSSGTMTNGKRLPTSGDNFVTYSYLGSLIGRTHTNSYLKNLILEAYQILRITNPKSCFVYGETSWKNGGYFWPHRTHKNGLSVDFMVPILNENNEPVCLETNVINKWGYALEFDSTGKLDSYQIDFEAIANHIKILNETASKYNLKINRVIFDVNYHPLLDKTNSGKNLINTILFTKFKPWVRHDEHYHIDFEFISN
ncbi:penicillin-insensitive murein endopeptidase [Leptospira bandrabouensis]|uniref:penicillin-insensitive murein endopeptidase n=2 Tax=Leptospira bandrabouensis TaxID=2484903 RepID=UPI001EEB0EA6|nr:penicillin-insensitive murein endopeptidase [Leptospira bandrabouensis]MCG6146539.1 penicillin-insensitive murein endopeptidase [Leptospira bandrabouensis]MCG6166123.1 penicillin-insensitive murein endopeptidase [Leptospira bandrabouensis]